MIFHGDPTVPDSHSKIWGSRTQPPKIDAYGSGHSLSSAAISQILSGSSRHQVLLKAINLQLMMAGHDRTKCAAVQTFLAPSVRCDITRRRSGDLLCLAIVTFIYPCSFSLAFFLDYRPSD